MSERDRDPDVFEFEDEPTSEELHDQVDKAQAALAELKRKSEQLERDKQRLEELSRRQDQLQAGREEMVDKLTRALVTVQRETQETEKRLDQLHSIHESFTGHLRTMEGINPKSWVGLDLSKELSKAISSVDDARTEYNRSIAKLGTDVPEPAHPHGVAAEYEEYETGDKGFLYWLIAGFAFTLPLQAIGVIGLLIWLWTAGGGQ